MSELAEFREETQAWLAENCPDGARGPGEIHTGSTKVNFAADTQRWMEAMAERGWTVPNWPKEYGGGGLSTEETRVLYEEMLALGARAPLVNMGTRMFGPTLLEYGTEDQKQRHLTVIAQGGAAWCQGYSEPGAGSDLASLRCRAEDKGDYFLINGQKIWTSGAQYADWMFCLVRTDFEVSKHNGISFVLLPMDQEGVTVKPIELISGSSPFCETFLDNAIAEKRDLVGQLNEGWTVGKRLLQHERSGQGGLGTGAQRSRPVGVSIDLEVNEVLNDYVKDPAIAPELRDNVIDWKMRSAAFRLTQKRAGEESRDGKTPGEATSVFKLYGSTLAQDRQDLIVDLMGHHGVAWEGDGFSSDEIGAARSWLASRSVTIYGGTNEVQANIIAKRVLGLPD
ncbi:MAG: acyl-CoA dehydrogenase family protein [Pseudomonadales bacterium]|nr:acyl-CoA dehydrogenase family protein [Pseudomonadales bacterium]MBO6594819.1 acyl-CoA dehydrogenase family protein [Pseudomonadales bacterium]MBO6821621.1 acyl-CoA dehydrogenase family protein [Pseudomonadales bacterium]